MIKKSIYLITIALLLCVNIQAQELNAKVTINTSKIQSADSDLFTTLQDNITQFLNDNKWTDATFRPNERIDCTFTLTVNSVDGASITGDLQITSRRPTYNSSYITPIFNFKDVDISFDYNRETLEFNETNLTSNLVAIMSFYSYIIIGLDFDTFSLNGGRPYFEKAMSIANAAQSFSNVKGWRAFDSDRNRYALALGLTEESSKNFHDLWYGYHRLGLDEMPANADRGRTKLIESLSNLDELYKARPSSVLVSFFGDTKLDELVNIFTKATSEEKQATHKMLQKIYPTKSSTVEKIKI